MLLVAAFLLRVIFPSLDDPGAPPPTPPRSFWLEQVLSTLENMPAEGRQHIEDVELKAGVDVLL